MPAWRQLLLRREADAETRLLYGFTLFICILLCGLSITASAFAYDPVQATGGGPVMSATFMALNWAEWLVLGVIAFVCFLVWMAYELHVAPTAFETEDGYGPTPFPPELSAEDRLYASEEPVWPDTRVRHGGLGR